MTKLYCPNCKNQVSELSKNNDTSINHDNNVIKDYLAKLHTERDSWIEQCKTYSPEDCYDEVIKCIEARITGLSFAINTFEQLFGNSEELESKQTPSVCLQAEEDENKDSAWINFADKKPEIGKRIEFESFDVDEETGQEILCCLGTGLYNINDPYHKKIKRWKPAQEEPGNDKNDAPPEKEISKLDNVDDANVVESKECEHVLGLYKHSKDGVTTLYKACSKCDYKEIPKSESQIAIDKVVEALQYAVEYKHKGKIGSIFAEYLFLEKLKELRNG